MNASTIFQHIRSWVAVLLVAAALVVSTVAFLSDDTPTAWDNIPALAGGDEEGIGGG